MQTQTSPCSSSTVAPCYPYQYLTDVDSGFSERDLVFQTKYDLVLPGVNMHCTRYCLLYLTKKGYTVFKGMFDFVFYPNRPIQSGQSICEPSISAFLNVPGGRGIKGQITTGHDKSLGKKSARVFSNSRTYQMYSKTKELSVGFNAQLRMESVAVDVVKPSELKDIQVTYAAAVLIEHYREKTEKVTLNGCCCVRIFPILLPHELLPPTVIPCYPQLPHVPQLPESPPVPQKAQPFSSQLQHLPHSPVPTYIRLPSRIRSFDRYVVS